MRILGKYRLGQLSKFISLFLLALCLLFLSGCSGKKEELPVVPPVTSPLTKDYIGFGVIKNSFTHMSADPIEDSASLGYLRRGSLVKVVRRQIVKTEAGFVSWVLTDGGTASVQGWLKEEVMDIYSNESQAKTASESLSK
ncbi:MAG: hypothetical protein FWB95_01995 [Treponema sp.]|nr:hypothetical protein [Treponema sp.]